MADTIAAVVALGLGVGLSPIPLIATIFMLFSQRADANGPSFLAGWVLGLSACSVVILLLASALDLGGGEDGGDEISWVRLIAGALLLAAAARKWQRRPRDGEPSPLPAWMLGVDAYAPPQAFRLGLLLSWNPKNLVLAVGAVANLRSFDADSAQYIVGLAVFVAVGSLLVATAVAFHRFGGAAAQARLDAAKQWLQMHNTAVLTGLFVVFGVVLVVQGLPSLLSDA